MVREVLTWPLPSQAGQGSHRTCASDSRVRLRVISTSPSGEKPLTDTLVRSRDSVFFSSASTASRCSTFSMSMKSMMMMPPRLRSRSWRAIACAASRLVLKIVSSKLRAADIAAGVDVDGRHRLGLVDDQVAARLQIDAPAQRALDLFLDVVQVEQRPLAGVVLQARQHARRVHRREFDQLDVVLARVDLDAWRFRRGRSRAARAAPGSGPGRAGWWAAGARARAGSRPGLAQVVDVGRQVGVRRVLGHGAHDVAAFLVGRQQAVQARAQRFALGFVFDLLRDADVRCPAADTPACARRCRSASTGARPWCRSGP